MRYLCPGSLPAVPSESRKQELGPASDSCGPQVPVCRLLDRTGGPDRRSPWLSPRGIRVIILVPQQAAVSPLECHLRVEGHTRERRLCALGVEYRTNLRCTTPHRRFQPCCARL